MAQIDLGKLKFNWKGTYADATAYAVDDVVYHNGSSWVVTAIVANSNTTDPEANSSFTKMANGLNNRGAWSNSSTYYQGDLVTHSNALYVGIMASGITGSTAAVTPGGSGSASNWTTLIPAPAAATLTTSGDLFTKDSDNSTNKRLPIGDIGAQLQVVSTAFEDITDKNTVVYSVNTTGTNTAILTLSGTTTNVGGGNNTTNASITLSRGRTYYFQFPADGQTYSFKNPADGSYATTGNGGRLGSGTSPASITNGGTIALSPDSNTPNTIKVRNETGGADEVTITVIDLRKGIAWSGTSSNNKHGGALVNDTYNTWTESLSPLPSYQKKFGRGSSNECHVSGAYRQCGYITKSGQSYSHGNHYNNGSQGIAYGGSALGHSINTHTSHQLKAQLRLPTFYLRALNGDANESKWLTDINGATLGYSVGSIPKIKQRLTGYGESFYLLENGILMYAGSNNYGMRGKGDNTSHIYMAVPVQFFDSSGTALQGTSRPKIKQLMSTFSHSTSTNTYSMAIALDTDGKVYTWGYNGYGQLGNGTTTNNYYAKQLAQSNFNNEAVIYVTCSTGRYTNSYAITSTGKCYGWGINGEGQLGLGNTTNQSTPQEITGVSGSPIEDKKIIHLMTLDGSQNLPRTYFLTDEGKVYFSGYIQDYGSYAGIYVSGNTDQTTPIELTNASTTINSGSQKVVSMWSTGGRYSTQYFITDGGTSNQPKMYSCGANNQGEQGTGSSITSGASASAQGNWFLSECVWQDFGDMENGANNSRPNEKIGTQYTFEDSSHANYRALKVGTIVKVIGHAYGGTHSTSVCALDSNGVLWFTGEAVDGYALNHFNEYDVNTYSSSFENNADHSTRWVPVWSQPEPFEDFAWINNSEQDQDAWIAIGKSGEVYSGGSNQWSQNGLHVGTGGFHPIDSNGKSSI
tara:strand:- start:1333 stop:4080 length:2748 start_codon:yes stop_codon:yes gene_type:complete